MSIRGDTLIVHLAVPDCLEMMKIRKAVLVWPLYMFPVMLEICVGLLQLWQNFNNK
jgi:hypothetical protein